MFSSRGQWYCVAAVMAAIVFHPFAAQAHPVPLASATITLEADGGYQLALDCDVAAFVMQARPGHLEAPVAEEFRGLPPEDLKALATDARRAIEQGMVLDFDGRLAHPASVELPELGALQQIFKTGPSGSSGHSARIRAAGIVPIGTRRCSIRFPPDIGPVALTIYRAGGDTAPQAPERQLLAEGQASGPILLAAPPNDDSPLAGRLGIAEQFLALGFEHILPFGLDHILFVLGLFLLSPHLKPLLWQVTAFTIAHSISLALSSCHIISLPASVVEPVIALSIALVALENIFTTQLKPWRPIVIFAFGLVHGMGFAEVLHETGLEHYDFLTALLAFNVGVELGQLAVIALAFLAVGWFRQRSWYRPRLAIPASCMIALAGLYWMAERIWF